MGHSFRRSGELRRGGLARLGKSAALGKKFEADLRTSGPGSFRGVSCDGCPRFPAHAASSSTGARRRRGRAQDFEDDCEFRIAVAAERAVERFPRDAGFLGERVMP
jgi:hypothetical protein